MPKSFKARSDRIAQASGDHLRAGEPRVLEDPVQGDRGEHRQEEEQAAELGPERRRAQVELADIGDIGRGRPRAGWTFVIGPAWQPRESFVFEDLCDGDRTERVALVGEVSADVIDGEVLLTQRDDAIAKGSALGAT